MSHFAEVDRNNTVVRVVLIDQETIYKKVAGLLNAYKAAYDAVSRIVALRTFGKVSSS